MTETSARPAAARMLAPVMARSPWPHIRVTGPGGTVSSPVQRTEAGPSPVVAQLLGRAADAEQWERFERQMRATGYCRQPVRLRGQVDAVDVGTGECRTVYSTEPEPDRTLLKCCGNRGAFTVVGIFADPVDSSDRRPQTRQSNFVIVPIFKINAEEPIVILRSKTPVAQIDALRAAIAGIDPDAPVFDVSTVEDILLNGVAGQRTVRWLFTTLGALALGISVLGIEGRSKEAIDRSVSEDIVLSGPTRRTFEGIGPSCSSIC